jgi:hypothetical protein
LASGLCGIVLLEYFRLSPRWFRWVLMLAGMGVAGRYALQAVQIILQTSPAPAGRLMAVWAAIGLTLPCAAALDQLVRHPAMTPKKLLQAYAPFAMVLAPVVAFSGPGMAASDRLMLAFMQGLFAMAVVWVSARLIRKIPGARIRLALMGLSATQLVLAGRRLAEIMPPSDLRLELVTDGLALAAIWWALTTARTSSA